MFTGIIEESGKLKSISKGTRFKRIEIQAEKVLEDLKVGDSININGACQTVVELRSSSFVVEAVEETLKRTNLGQLKPEDQVNLERSLKLSDRLSGHILTGHVDCTGSIKSITRTGDFWTFEFSLPETYLTYIVEKGSVGVEGISLTVVDVLKDSFSVSVIPFTFAQTNLSKKREGDSVNIEVDLLGKFVKRFLDIKSSKEKITQKFLKERGW
jgi:riboflavin synthase